MAADDRGYSSATTADKNVAAFNRKVEDLLARIEADDRELIHTSTNVFPVAMEGITYFFHVVSRRRKQPPE